MSSLKQLSKIDTRTKYAVYGWVRASERNLQLENVPNMITAICILFFRRDEIFKDIDEEYKESIQLSANKKCVTRLKDAIGGTLNIFGKNEILSTNIHGKYQWDVKVNQFSKVTAYDMLIGIQTVNPSTNGCIMYYYFSDGQLYTSVVGASTKNAGHSYGSGDKISIYLDLDERKIAFSLNGVEQHVCNELEQGKEIKWRLCVTFWKKGESVQIENFKGL